MIISPIFFSSFNFLHFVRMSITVTPGVSSITIFDSDSGPIADASFAQSSSSSFPVLILLESTIASLHNILFTNCSFDISRLNIATPAPPLIAAFAAKFSANAVFPIAGLAAINISSEPCNPAVL